MSVQGLYKELWIIDPLKRAVCFASILSEDQNLQFSSPLLLFKFYFTAAFFQFNRKQSCLMYYLKYLYGSVGGRTKQPILNETKPPILKMRQNRRFWKWDKTADFENETKPPISKMRQNRRFWSGTKPPILKWDKTADFKVGQDGRFCKREQTAIKIFRFSDKSVLA